MRLIINGEVRDNLKAETVMQLLDELEIGPGRVAVEVNLVIVKKADYETFSLHDGDAVEIVNFVGGGCLSRGLPFAHSRFAPRFLPLDY